MGNKYLQYMTTDDEIFAGVARTHTSGASNIVVREARTEDIDAVITLNVMAWNVRFRGLMDDAFLDARTPSPERRPSALLDGRLDSIELVAVLDDTPVAWLASHPAEDEDLDSNKVFEIKACYTHPDHWRRGAARLLVQNLWERLDGSRWDSVILWTPRDSERSNRFYESVGFELDGASKNWNYGAGEIALVRFQRHLTA